MKSEKDYPDLSKEILSPIETWTVASNLNAIERERERQNNPTTFDYFISLLGGIAAFPFIIFAAYEMLRITVSGIEFIIIFGGAVIALWLDIAFIKVSWYLMRKSSE